MIRQRIRARPSPLAYLSRVLIVALALGLVWYGSMLVLLALKVFPGDVERVSGYRSIYDFFADLEPADSTGRLRLILGLGGLAVFVCCLFLAWKEVPRPYLARNDLPLYEDERTTVAVEPRAIERAAELAAGEAPAVSSAVARYGGEDLAVDVEVKRARNFPETVRDVQRRVTEALDQHELPRIPVSVTVTGFNRKQRRELN